MTRRSQSTADDGQLPLFADALPPAEPAPPAAVSEAAAAEATALARAAARERAYVPIDYKAAQAEFTKQKGALTRAVNSKDPDRILIACRDAVRAWNRPGRSWPDSWSTWQCALNDSRPWHSPINLEDLA